MKKNPITSFLSSKKALEDKIFHLEMENERLLFEVDEAQDKIQELQDSAANPLKVFEALFLSPPKWYDYQELSHAERVKYFEYAQHILDNPVYKNEMAHFIADIMDEISFRSRDYPHVENLRYSVNGVKAFQERLAAILDPRKDKPTEFDPNEGI